ncbi:MAG: arylsulfatase [Oscillospiraceae bacterium]
MNKKPNVLIFLTDDQGYGDLSKSGNKNLSTPIIDNLEKDGAKMMNFYTCPLCAPSRAELLTGRQFIKTGVYGVTRKAEYINLDETTIGDVFQENGYRTACFGKWHSGSLYPYHPNGRGFEEFYGFCCGHWGYYFNTTMDHNGKEVRGKNYIIDDVTNHAIDYIDQNSDKPFLCYVAYNTPHSPYQVPEKFYEKFRDFPLISRAEEPEKENIDITRAVMAMCENIDWNMGRVLEKIKEKGIEEDTIILYLSDNGPTGSVRYNSGLKGLKGGINEGSVKTACSITWKNHIPKGMTVNQLSSTMDILPTMAGLCQIHAKTNHALDGIDLTAYLTENKKEITDRNIFALQTDNGSVKLSVRNQRYRYIHGQNELYDINNDSGEQNNILDQNKEIGEELKKICDQFKQENVPDKFDTRYLTIGYPQHPKSYLNAQDGEPQGKITWSSIHPNCSYFMNWDNEADVMKWPVMVKESGKYQVTVMYTCEECSPGNILTVQS